MKGIIQKILLGMSALVMTLLQPTLVSADELYYVTGCSIECLEGALTKVTDKQVSWTFEGSYRTSSGSWIWENCSGTGTLECKNGQSFKLTDNNGNVVVTLPSGFNLVATYRKTKTAEDSPAPASDSGKP